MEFRTQTYEFYSNRVTVSYMDIHIFWKLSWGLWCAIVWEPLSPHQLTDYALLQKERTLKFQWLKIKPVHFSLHMLHRQGYRATLLIRIMLMEQLPQPLLMITIQKEGKRALEPLTPGIKFSSGPKVTQISSSHNASVWTSPLIHKQARNYIPIIWPESRGSQEQFFTSIKYNHLG